MISNILGTFVHIITFNKNDDNTMQEVIKTYRLRGVSCRVLASHSTRFIRRAGLMSFPLLLYGLGAILVTFKFAANKNELLKNNS